MKFIEINTENIEEEIAIDEALLEESENSQDEFIRFWEAPSYYVVLGRGNKVAENIMRTRCEQDDIPILRRASGGGTILQGPGCLNYTLCLNLDRHSSLESIPNSNSYILKEMITVFHNANLEGVIMNGETDLTVGPKKFSGNAQRRKRKSLLFHGTILYNFDLSKIAYYLSHPPKEPDYRQNRDHTQFLDNITLNTELFKKSAIQHWKGDKCELNLATLKEKHPETFKKYHTKNWHFER